MMQEIPFDQWKKSVDNELEILCGLSSESIPDVDYRGLYITGDTPEQAVRFAYDEALQS